MDEEYFFNTEKQSIRESARSLKKYGSTCNHVRNSECLVRHDLAATDTLQGIALKYGCSVSIRHILVYNVHICMFPYVALRTGTYW